MNSGPLSRYRYAAAITAVLVCCCPASSPAAPAPPIPEVVLELHGSLVRALVAGDLSRAAEQLPLLAASSPAMSRALHHRYLEGLLHETAGEGAAAREAFLGYLAAEGDQALLAPYAQLRLAGLLERDGEQAAAAEAFSRAARLGGRQWPPHGEAILGAVRCAAAAGNCEQGAQFVGELQGRRTHGLVRQAGVLLGRCLIDAGELEAGRSRLQLLLGEDQGDDPALEAYLLLTGLGRNPGGAAPRRSMFTSPGEEAWCMGNTAYRNRRFAEAVSWLGSLVEPGEESIDRYQDKATFLIGRCRLLEGEFDSARQWFLLAGEQFPESLAGQDGLYFAAVCQLRLGNHKAALEELNRLAVSGTRPAVALKAVTTAAWPLKTELDAAGLDQLSVRAADLGGDRDTQAGILMHLADVQRRRGDIPASMTTLQRVLSHSNHDDSIHAEAALRLARHLSEAGRTAEALQQCLYVSRLEVPYLFRDQARVIASGMALESFADQDQIMIQGARNLLEADEPGAAREELEKFLLTCGWSSKRRVAANLLQELYRREVPYNIPYWVRPLQPAALEAAAAGGTKGDGLRRAAALLRIGQFREAAEELEVADGRSSLDRYDRQYSISLWSMMGGNNALSLRACERLTASIPSSAVQESLPLNIRLLLYPGHFYPLVSREAEMHGLDPLLLLAVLREESRFGSGLRSGAAARGLMQILPETAAAVSARCGIEYSGADDLYRPEFSIAIGAAYLASLMERYQGNSAAALSAYNGGEANADRWLAGASDPGDLFDFIREVTFRESRDYVIKVLSSYRAYQALDTKLVGHTSEIVGSFVDWDLFAADLPAIR
jgi:soluble lytic murein transglycosylase-like protein